jgi:CheY-like chemotaxis protein
MVTALQTLVRAADAHNEQPVETKQPPPRLLIVDDEAAVRDMFMRLLRGEGYDVRAVATPGAGLDAVAEWRPDAILLDYRMPFANGVGFLYRLRAHESASRTPVAVITGARDVGGALATECATLGAAVYFKPLERDGLRNVARTLLTSNSAPMMHLARHLASIRATGCRQLELVPFPRTRRFSPWERTW